MSVFYSCLFKGSGIKSITHRAVYSYLVYKSIPNANVFDVYGGLDSSLIVDNLEEGYLEYPGNINKTQVGRVLNMDYKVVMRAVSELTKSGLIQRDANTGIVSVYVLSDILESKYFPISTSSGLSNWELIVYSFLRHFYITNGKKGIFMTNKVTAERYLGLMHSNYLRILHSLERKGFLERREDKKLYVNNI